MTTAIGIKLCITTHEKKNTAPPFLLTRELTPPFSYPPKFFKMHHNSSSATTLETSNVIDKGCCGHSSFSHQNLRKQRKQLTFLGLKFETIRHDDRGLI